VGEGEKAPLPAHRERGWGEGLSDILSLLETAVAEDPSGAATIRPGFAPDLDDAIDAVRDTKEWLTALEGRERERTGIRSLKVGFNKVFGYYIEVTRPNLGLVPTDYARKQTIANGERFVTVPLKDAEVRVLAADEEIAAREREALARLSALVIAEVGRLSATARALAELDALLALAEVAARNGWTAPEIDESDTLEIVSGRHPVVEAHLGGEPFIPNDCRLGGDGARQAVVTGPNMGGKSTFLRQCALVALLAQIGAWVPAARARVGLVDRIFTRVGAHDDLARGQSTFMTEMVETAAILHQASDRSLLILDEVGRGTATADGLAIARAVLEDIARRIRARALFATHYLELAAVAGEIPSVANLHVAALEREGRVVFLYAVQPGPADRAYGIQVARLAGLPAWVADRAGELLREASRSDREALPRPRMIAEDAKGIEDAEDPGDRPAVSPAAEQLAAALRSLDLAETSPRRALEWLWEQQERLLGEVVSQDRVPDDPGTVP
jgi:DNA mismatch repair protein MutS